MRGLLLLAGVLTLAVLSGQAEEKLRLDADGDPLPPGALLRLGTTRFHHGGMPSAVTYLDATTLLSTGGDGVLRVWEVPTGRQLRALPGVTLADTPLATDGKVVVAVDAENRFAAWDPRTGKVLRTFGYGAYASGAAVRGDTFVFGITPDITVWDIDGQKPLRTLESDRDRHALRALALSSDGQMTATARDGTVRLWETATGKQVRELPVPEGERICAMAFAPGKPSVLAATEPGGKTRLWDVATGKVLHRFEREWGTGLAFTPDGKFLALAGKTWDEGIALFNLSTFEEVRRFRGGPRYAVATGLAISPDGKYLASSGTESTVQVWEIATGKSLLREDQPHAGVRDLRLSPDGKLLLLGHDNLEVRVWDLATGQSRDTVPPEKGGVVAGWGKDGRFLMARPSGFTAAFSWHDPATGKEEKAFQIPQSIHTLALTPDAAALAVLTTTNGNLCLWDAVKGVELHALDRPKEGDSYDGLNLSPDGKLLATAGAVRDVRSGVLVRFLTPGHGTTVNGVAFSPDSKTVATVSSRAVRLYETETTRPPQTIELPSEGSARTGYGVAFHPDGKRLAVAEREGVALFDLATSKLVHRWKGQRGIIRQLTFTPDGKRLITGGSDATVLVWDVPPAM
jgi:WD40 repeat protein